MTMDLTESTSSTDAARDEASWPTQQRLLCTPIPGPASLARQAHRATSVAGGIGTVLPIFVKRAGGGIIVDVDGNHIIDLASGIATTTVGASHPEVVRRVREQVGRFTHTCFLVTEYDGYVEVCDRLNALTPGTHAKKSALFSTGSEAVENAVKIARAATRRPAIVTFGHAYHGRTLLTMTMTAKNAPYKDGFGPFAPEVYRAPLAYPFRSGLDAAGCSAEAMAALDDLVVKQLGAHNVAAIVVEPIQGEGGFIVPPPGHLAAIQEFAHRHGILLVADEVQTGIGRTGAWFASTAEGIVPDLIVPAKGLGGGLPLAAVTGRAELMDAVAPGGLGGTYAGNPVACAASLGALDAIVNDGLLERAQRIGEITSAHLAPLVGTHPWVGEVRGRGAMQALEFVRPGTLEPAPEAAASVVAHCHRAGVLAISCGTYGNVIRLLPPLTISDALLTEGLGVIVEGIRSLA